MGGINRTTKYFFVPFSEESSSFITNYNICYRNDGVRIYLDDLEKTDDYGQDTLYVCFDRNKILRFEERLTFFKFADNYIADYPLSESKHVVVFRIPEKFRKTFSFFYNGEYSKMYDGKTIELCFKDSKEYFFKYKSIPVTVNNIKILDKDNLYTTEIENIGVLKNILSLEKDFSNIVLSPYHVLKKSKELIEIISKLYSVDKRYIDELDSKPIISEEVLRYKILENIKIE